MYVYKSEGLFNVGDVVEAPTNNYETNDVGIVKKVKFLSRNKLPVEYERVLKITKKLNTSEYVKDFFPIRYMKERINESLIKEWQFAYKNNWVKVYTSEFEGCVSYEKDGVFTGSLYKCTDENFFEEYTLTNRKNFKIKLKYFQTILSELYYRKITQSEFLDLLDVI